MIYTVPSNWKYDESIEMLYLFYQKTDELLSQVSPITYSLPLHNVMTLVKEMDQVFDLLNEYGMISEYYSKYIVPILEEFLSQTEEDYVLKKILGNRLFNIRTGFTESLRDHTHLKEWINVLKQACTLTKYREAYREEISHLIMHTHDKNKLLLATERYFTCLVDMGYSREYLYTSLNIL